MFRYFIYNTYLRFNFHSRFHFGAVFVGPDGLMQPPFHIFTIVKHNVFLMTVSSPFAFSPKEVLWPLRFPWYQKQVTKAFGKKKALHAIALNQCDFTLGSSDSHYSSVLLSSYLAEVRSHFGSSCRECSSALQTLRSKRVVVLYLGT